MDSIRLLTGNDPFLIVRIRLKPGWLQRAVVVVANQGPLPSIFVIPPRNIPFSGSFKIKKYHVGLSIAVPINPQEYCGTRLIRYHILPACPAITKHVERSYRAAVI